MLNVWLILSIILLAAFVFEFINGFHDTANSIATTVSTRVLSPRGAILMAAVLNFVGAYASTPLLPELFPNVFKHAVAKTISKGLINETVPQHVIIAALCAAIIWGLVTWRLGLPSSSSHAVIGGLLGASIVDFWHVGIVNWFGVWDKVILWLFASPVIGFIVAFLVMNLLFELLRKVSMYVATRWFSKLQIFSAAFMAFSHGSNDAQKTMGIITMALISLGATHTGEFPAWMMPSESHPIPFWVIIACGVVMALGTSLGGWRIIKTMGVNMIKLNPVGGFAAETSAALVIETCSFFGIPLSTTHVISSSIMGVGAAKRFSSVRWTVARSMVFAWVFTIPVSMALGALIDLAVKGILKFV